MLLPVDYVLAAEGALLLGAGRDVAKSPAEQDTLDHATAPGVAAWLSRRNDVELTRSPTPGERDIVLLGVRPDTSECFVHGLPGARVGLAPAGKDAWPGAGWLHAALTDAHRPDQRPFSAAGARHASLLLLRTS